MSPPGGDRHLRPLLLCFAVLVAGHAAAGNPPIRGFVAAGLLRTWCSADTSIDREACWSYLRGVFDSFHLSASLDDDTGPRLGRSVRCIPDRIAAAELQASYLRYMDGRPELADRQAASVVLEFFESHFTCGG